MPDSNVIKFPNSAETGRKVMDLSLEDFCAADESGDWMSRHDMNGMVVLQWPHIIMIRCGASNCMAICRPNINLADYISGCFDALEQVA